MQIDADPDPDPAYHFDADPYPTFHFYAYPDPQHCSINQWKKTLLFAKE